MNRLHIPQFSLTDTLTQEQITFFEKNGLIIFKNFITKETVELFIKETQRIEKDWLEKGIDKINGIPLKFGRDEKNNKIIQRLCFLSHYSTILHDFLEDSRLQALLA